MERRSYTWFERRRRIKALELTQAQITKALDTITLLYETIQYVSEEKKREAEQSFEKLFTVEEEVDKLRRAVFKELSQGTALFTEYREDLMHLVTRLDTLADHVKDVARCAMLLSGSQIPMELWEKVVHITHTLVNCASALGSSIKNLTVNPVDALREAQQVEDIENEIDTEYMALKSLLITHAEQMNCGAMVIFHDLVEFVEQAADMCANTADYILVLVSRD